jgi:hypothetical protein
MCRETAQCEADTIEDTSAEETEGEGMSSDLERQDSLRTALRK